MMGPKRPLDGWRFATAAEVLRMFADFTGTADGRSRDAVVEREFQQVLGGPLFEPKSLTGGYTRLTQGNIAGFTTPDDSTRPANIPRFQFHYAILSESLHEGLINAQVTPDMMGWTDGDRTSPRTGTFLVRPH